MTETSTPVAPVQSTEPVVNTTVNKVENKGKGTNKVITCFCCLILFFIFAIIGLGIYAYTTKTNIPVLSDIISGIESIFNSNSKAETSTKKAVGSLFNSLLAGNEDNGLVNSLLQSNVSKEKINSLFSESKAVNTAKYELRFKMSGPIVEGTYGKEEIDFDIVIKFNTDMGDLDNLKADYNIVADIEAQGMAFSIDLDMIVIGEDVYLKINSYPVLIEQYVDALGLSKSVWYKIPASMLESSTSGLVDQSENPLAGLKDEDIDKLLLLLSDKTLLKNFKELADENIEGINSECFELSWDKDELNVLVKRMAEIFSDESMKVEEDSLEDLELLTVNMCLSKDGNNWLTKLGSNLDLVDDANITFQLKIWGYNESLSIKAPSNYENFEVPSYPDYPDYPDYDF